MSTIAPEHAVGSPTFDSVAASLDASIVQTSLGVHQLAPADTELAFDPGDLGREVPLERLDSNAASVAAETAVRLTPFPPDLEAELSSLYHIGRSGGVHLFVAIGETRPADSDSPRRRTVFQTVLPDSLLGPAPSDGVSIAGSTRDDFSADRGFNRATVVAADDEVAARLSMLAPEVAVVAIETSDGQRLWQRPAGGFALIALPSVESSYRWELLDRFGEVVDAGGWVSFVG